MDKFFHDVAKAVKPHQETKASRYWVGILYHNKSFQEEYAEEDFLWIKAHGKITVETIHNEYVKKHPLDIVLKLDGSIPAKEARLVELNKYNDNVITLRALEAGSAEAVHAGARSPSATRSPLAPTNGQVTTKPEATLKWQPPKTTSTQNISPYIDSQAQENAPVAHHPTQPQGDDALNLAPYSPGTTARAAERLPGLASVLNRVTTAAAEWPEPISCSRAPSTALNSDSAASKPTTTADKDEKPSGSALSPANDKSVPNTVQANGWNAPDNVKAEPDTETKDVQPSQSQNLQQLITGECPDTLEAGVQHAVRLLERLEVPLSENMLNSQEAGQWLQALDTLRSQAKRTRTVIGVVGNTGAGKSSVINAVLDEERLLPTNCMRACTAVVTEISWNDSTDEDSRYVGEIEFITLEDWQKELEILFKDMLDSEGHMVRDASNPDTEAGIAYAKIKAVYPRYTKEMFAEASVKELMAAPGVRGVLGTTKRVANSAVAPFYHALQSYVDSQEKSTGEDRKDKKKKKEKPMEFWPLIKVVKIYTKAAALSTGAVVVDLPGVHDSNAARAAVADGYMKNCTGLWVVAPVTRAVDDKAAKKLLGDSFKRQLKFDGTYSAVTFICSKTDDISVTEAADSLGLNEEVGESFERLDEIASEIRDLKQQHEELKQSRAVYKSVQDDMEELQDTWDELKDKAREGETVYAPVEKKRKRKRADDDTRSRKKEKLLGFSQETISVDSSSDDSEFEESGAEGSGVEEDDVIEEPRKALTEEEIEQKIDEIKGNKKNARAERSKADDKIQEILTKVKELKKEEDALDAENSKLCIAGRNEYSKGAIRLDFAAGIKELDQEHAAEEDEEKFNPEDDMRDYDEVANTLPVFCVSSRAYQKLCGRLRKDASVHGFGDILETEIPQLRAHCQKTTDHGRLATCRAFLNSFSQLLNSLSLWANDDGNGHNLSAAQRNAQSDFLQKQLQSLHRDLENGVKDCLKHLQDQLAEQIFEHFTAAVDLAAQLAPGTAEAWGAHRDQGGLYWATYKAVCRRNGTYTSPTSGLKDFNGQLTEPVTKVLAAGWERAFARRIPHVLRKYSESAKKSLRHFHELVEKRARQTGVGVSRTMILSQQLNTYEQTFVQLGRGMEEMINKLQRETNREFVPPVAAAMLTAYEECTNEKGPGSYKRMKSTMRNHVHQHQRYMFESAVDTVRSRLLDMCRQVEQYVGDESYRVYGHMKRDYMAAIGGVQLKNDAMLPRMVVQLRSKVAEIIEFADDSFAEILGNTTGQTEKAKDQASSNDEIRNHGSASDGLDAQAGSFTPTEQDSEVSSQQKLGSVAADASADNAMDMDENPQNATSADQQSDGHQQPSPALRAPSPAAMPEGVNQAATSPHHNDAHHATASRWRAIQAEEHVDNDSVSGEGDQMDDDENEDDDDWPQSEHPFSERDTPSEDEHLSDDVERSEDEGSFESEDDEAADDNA